MSPDDIRHNAKDDVAQLIDDLADRLFWASTGVFDSEDAARTGLERQARKFIDYLDEKGELSDRQASLSVATGALNTAAGCLDIHATPAMIAKKVDVSETTVARYHRLIRDHLLEDYRQQDTELSKPENDCLIDEAMPEVVMAMKGEEYAEAMLEQMPKP